ncbi:MAG: ATP-grasp domain-containing protein [Phycisphaerae bacterium]|nr:ATP-grasp domain-containing protein [Phycisphaerae bacterium]
MARLSEHDGKRLLALHGVAVPRGLVARTADEAERAASTIGCPVVVKIQAWTTGRAAIGGVAFANSPAEAATHARRMLTLVVGQFPVESILIEEKIEIARELFVSLAIDDRDRAPVLLFSPVGGSGVEERAASTSRIACNVLTGPDEVALAAAVEAAGGASLPAIMSAIRAIFTVAKSAEARSVEINPLVVTRDGRVVAADCRVTIDDYAVFRHPELGIEIAREFDHPPTALERVAYAVEQADHRGTFYFAQLATTAPAGSRGLVGFHGAGGGGSMMAMDAITSEGFTVADFTDTSGNPSSAKVYRAARIILSQPGLVGYFGSGSGVASQEQFWSAYGLAKAFWELELDIPAVIRLGGNTEDRAVDILASARRDLRAPVEGYCKTDSPALIARRFAELVAAAGGRTWAPRSRRVPPYVGAASSLSMPIKGGCVWIDAARWSDVRPIVVANSTGLVRDDNGKPAFTLPAAELAHKDSEFIACEVECRRAGDGALFVDLDIPGLAAISSAKEVR